MNKIDISTRQVAFDLLERLRDMLKMQHRLFFEIGKLLIDLKEKSLYKSLGEGGYDTWPAFLASNELGIGKSTAQAYMSLYEFWVTQKGYEIDKLAEVPYDKLRMVLPAARAAKNDADVEELFFKAKELSRSDLSVTLGLSDDDGRLKTRVISVTLCDTCKGYRLPEDLVTCSCKGVKQ